MTNVLSVKLPRPHPAQRSLKADQRRFNVIPAGRRWGKSTFAVDAALTGRKGMLAGYPVGIFVPHWKYAKELWKELKWACAPITTYKHEGDFRIELIRPLGSCEFWTLDDPNAGRSRKYGTVVVDEAGLIKKLMESWDESLRATLIDFKGDAWFFGTPKGINDFHELYQIGLTRRDWLSRRMTTYDNPHLDPTEIEDARLQLPELVFRQEFLAEFIDRAGTIVRREWLQYEDGPRHMATGSIGVDPAITAKQDSDFSAFAVVAHNPDGTSCVLEVTRTQTTFHGLLEEIYRLYDKWNQVLPIKVIGIEAVQAQQWAVQELVRGRLQPSGERREPLPVVPVPVDKDKVTRFLPVQAKYEHRLVYHSPGLSQVFEDELLAFPMSEHDDQVDALTVAYRCARPRNSEIAVAGKRVF